MPAHRSPPSAALRERSPARVATFACASRHLRLRESPPSPTGDEASREHSPFPQDRGAALRQTPVHAARRPEGTAVSAMPDSSDFRSPYRHGFLRVAAATLRTVIADPAANAAAVLATARECADEGVGLAIFPELTLTGYSIEDILLQDTLLDAVEAALAEVVAASADLLPVLVVGLPVRGRNRIYNVAAVVHRGRLLGVAPKSYLPTYREFYERRQVGPGDDLRGTIHLAGAEVPFGPDLLFAAEDVPGFVLHVEICEDMWVPVPPSATAALAGRDRAGQPVRQPDHHRPGGDTRPAGAVGVGALPGGVRLRGGRRGRVDHRPRLGRPDDDLRERHPARRDRALSEGPAALGRRRRPRSAACRAAADGHLRRQPPRPRRAHRRLPDGRRSGSTRPAATSGCGARWSASRSCRPTRAAGAGLLRGLQHPGRRPGAAAAGDRTAQARHRRVRRARLDPRADRRREGDRPRGPPAHRHPRAHPCRASPPAARPRPTPCG